MEEVKDIKDQKDIDDLRALLDEEEAEDLVDGTDLHSDMVCDCD